MDALIKEVFATNGDFLMPDGWRGLGGLLEEGDSQTTSYIGSAFRVKGTQGSYPVNVEITGRKVWFRKFSKPAVRVRIEWVEDGEPSTFTSGWLILHSGQV